MGSKFAQKSSLQDALPLAGRSNPRNALLWIVAGYLLLIGFGYVALRADGAMSRGHEMSRERAWFAAVNATTLTGFQQTIALSDYRPAGQIAILVMTVGGMMFTLIVGGWAVARIARMRFSDERIVMSAGITVLAAATIGSFKSDDTNGALGGMFETLSAMGNSGLAFQSGSTGLWTVGLLLPLALIGGLGLPVLMECGEAIFRARPLSRHSRLVILMTAGTCMTATLVFVLVKCLHVPPTSAETWRGDFVSSAVAAMNARTAGFPLEPVFSFPRTMEWLLSIVMIIGAAPGGTGGGLKVTTVVIVVVGVVRSFRREIPGRAFACAMLWIAIYFSLLLLTHLVLLHTQPQMPADRLLFIAISAISNVGLSHDPISLTGESLHAITVAMLLARLVPVAILWWMVSWAREETVAAA